METSARLLLTVIVGSQLLTNAQTIEERGGLDRYRGRELPARNLQDSSRLDTLIRAGSLYLSLQDAIALAIENNLDVDYQRLTPRIAEADLLRARAGSVARGIPSSVREGPSGVGSTSATSISAAQGTIPQTEQSSGFTSNPSVPASGVQTSATGPSVPLLDPTLTGTLSLGRSNRPQTNTFITGTNALTTATRQGTFGLQKGFLLGGTGFIGIDDTRSDVNNLRADVNPSASGGISASFTQPLLRGFGLAVNNRYIRIAKNNLRLSDLTFQQQVITTTYAVVRLYWDLVTLIAQRRVQQRSLELAQNTLNQNVQQEQAGTVAPIDVVRARAAVATARRDVTVAETRVRQQETILKDYLTRRNVDDPSLLNVTIVPTESLPAPAQSVVRPLQDLVQDAREHRTELAEADLQVANQRITLTGSRSGLLPEVDLFANGRTNALYGSVNQLPPAVSTPGTPVVRTPDPAFLGGIGTGLSQLFTGRFPDYTVGVQLNIPLLNRTAQADYARDQLALRQVEIRRQQAEKQIRVDIINALTAVEQSRAAFDAAREARVFQEQSLEAEREKYAVGASTPYLLIQYQRDLVEAQTTEVAAQADYAKAEAALERATGTLLDRFGVQITH